MELEFDVNPWIEEFPIHPREVWGPFAGSPIDLANIVDYRQAVCYRGPCLPADVFAFSKGECPRRDATKIGGLPFRQKSRAWPLDTSGQPMTFLAQLRLVESQEFLGTIPGNILLVFAEREDLSHDELSQLRFEWQTVRDVEDLIQLEDLPEPSWELLMCWGKRIRMPDFPLAMVFAAAAERWGSRFAVIDGTKVGGWSGLHSVDSVDSKRNPIAARAISEDLRALIDPRYLPKREAFFVAQIGPIFPNPRAPWCNLRHDPDLDPRRPDVRLSQDFIDTLREIDVESLKRGQSTKENVSSMNRLVELGRLMPPTPVQSLAWYDVMSIRIFADREGNVEWLLAENIA